MPHRVLYCVLAMLGCLIAVLGQAQEERTSSGSHGALSSFHPSSYSGSTNNTSNGPNITYDSSQGGNGSSANSSSSSSLDNTTYEGEIGRGDSYVAIVFSSLALCMLVLGCLSFVWCRKPSALPPRYGRLRRRVAVLVVADDELGERNTQPQKA